MFVFASLKLALFRWKILRRRHWFLFIIEFLTPAVFFFLVAYGRSKISKYSPTTISEVTVPAEISSDLLLNSYFEVSDTYIFYTPDTPLINNLIRKVQIKFQMTTNAIERFRSEDDLMKYYTANNNGTIIAILFNTPDEKQLEYTIRIHKGNMIWDTNRLFDTTPNYIPEMGSSNYIYNGILALQYALDSSYIELLGNYTELPFKFLFQEFPYPPYKSDTFLIEMCMTYLPWITLFSFVPLCLGVLKSIVEEKQTGGKELLKMAGLTPSLLYSGWFLHAFATYSISVSLIVCLMKVPLFGTPYAPIEHCNGFIYFVFLLSYFTASTVFCMAMSTLFNKASIAMMCMILVWILSYLVPVSLISETTPWSLKMILALLPNMALYFGYSEISVYEIRELDLNLQTWTTRGDGWNQALLIPDVLMMFVIQIVLYGLVTIYVESIYPGEYGIPKRIDYPVSCLKELISKMFKKPADGYDAERINLSGDVEECRLISKGIEIRELVKNFGHKTAVNKLSLHINDNQITVLLGHNGAGKTTTMSIITGMVQATSGTVQINGEDIKFKMDEIRKGLGWCPQHNLLFHDFTVFEHFVYFGLLRGMNRRAAEEEANIWINKLDLTREEKELAVNLSGGMKRKLCLGLALVGDTKVLILDEPTSGMDPETRRKIWDLLKNERSAKTFLITTHFMEEADALSDQIAIMGNGELIEYGTPMDLKKKYGAGYNLSLMLGSNQRMLKEELYKKIHLVLNEVRRNSQYALKKQLIRRMHSVKDSTRNSNYLPTREQLSATILSVIDDVKYFLKDQLNDKIGSAIDDSRRRIHSLLKEQLTEKIRSVIENAQLECQNGNNLVYILPMNETMRFPKLFKVLENFIIDDTNVENQRRDGNLECDKTKTESRESSDEEYKKVVNDLVILENIRINSMKMESKLSPDEMYKQILQELLKLLENLQFRDDNYEYLGTKDMEIDSRQSSGESYKQIALEWVHLLRNAETSDACHGNLRSSCIEIESKESADDELKQIEQKLLLLENIDIGDIRIDDLKSNSTKIEWKDTLDAEFTQKVDELLSLENSRIDENPICSMSVSVTTLDEVFQRSYDRFITQSKKTSNGKQNDHDVTSNENLGSSSLKSESKKSCAEECQQNCQELSKQLEKCRIDENSNYCTLKIKSDSSVEKFERMASLLPWLINSLLSLTYKRMWFAYRKLFHQLIYLIIAAAIMSLVAYLSSPFGFYARQEPEIEFNLKTYGGTKILYEFNMSNSEVNTAMKNTYHTVAKNQTDELDQVSSLLDAIIEKGKENIVYYKYHMIVAAAFRNKDIYVMYGNRALHGAPISLNIVMNAVLKTLIGSDYSTRVTFAPLQDISTPLSAMELSEMQVGIVWVFLVPIAISFLMGSFLLLPNKEHITKFSQLQFRTGVSGCWYWLSNFLFDFIVLYLPSVFLLSSIGLINELFRSINIISE